MSNQQDAKEAAKLDLNFDVRAWALKIFRTIDANRSDSSGNPSVVIDSSADASEGENSESRLNCFYRLIGLPATRDESILNTQVETKILSQSGTLNYFHNKEVFDTVEKMTKLASREQALQKPIDVKDMVKIVTDPIPITTEFPSRKISIVPLVVDATIPVFPLKKRVAPAFSAGDYLLPGNPQVRLPRTFLESIIYIRTQQFEQKVEEKSEETLSALKALLVQSSQGISNAQAAQDLKTFLDDISEKRFTKLETDVINKLVIGIRNAAYECKKTFDQGQLLSKQVRFSAAVSKDPNQKSGTIAYSVETASTDSPPIDSAIASLKLKLEAVHSFINILPTAKVKEADTTYRIVNNLNIANFTDDIFVSEFTDIIGYEREAYEAQLREAQEQRAAKIREFESIRQSIQLFTGEGLGLSIFDILCVFLSLFTIDLKYLVGLLNTDSRDRLRSSKFFSFQSGNAPGTIKRDAIFADQDRLGELEVAIGDARSVSESLTVLEQTVAENFKLAQAFFIESLKAGQNRA